MMKMEWITVLSEAGVDTASALRRFSGNVTLYKKFLLKFPLDDTFKQIHPALRANDWETALAAAHSLKGVSGNLSLTPIFDACTDTVTLLREEKYDKAVKSYETLRHAYTEILKVIRLIEEEYQDGE